MTRLPSAATIAVLLATVAMPLFAVAQPPASLLLRADDVVQ